MEPLRFLFDFAFFYLRCQFQCKNPTIEILSPHGGSFVSNTVEIKGEASCLSSSYRIAVLIHRIQKGNDPNWWFIHPDCATLFGKDSWQLSGVLIGTQNTLGYKFEIYSYAVPDSICAVIHNVTSDPTYQGTSDKPTWISGVYDRITVTRQ